MGLTTWPWILSLFIMQVICQQHISKHPQYTEVNPGQVAHLECTIENKKGECGWQKDRQLQGFIGKGKKYAWNGNQEKGDCSLVVLNASLEMDDGEWECQVTASALGENDAQTSTPARLLVRVAPADPVLEYQSIPVPEGNNITIVAHRNGSVYCISRHGNPPANLKWYLGSEDVTGQAEQKNNSEGPYSKLWTATSVLQLELVKEQNGAPLKCVATHEAYERKSRQVKTKLNVQYLPVVTLDKTPIEDVEDGKDSVRMECKVDANPSAFTLWKKDGRDLAVDRDIFLNPVRREDAGLYTCQGSNELGSSEPASFHLDVKYSPTNVRVLPGATQAKVYNQTSLMCMADGNPPPRFIWLFSANGDPSAAQPKGVDANLHIDNVTYDAQGMYVCIAANSIKGEERTAQSEEVKVDVFGIPQILNPPTQRNPLQVERGEDAILQVPFCSDPPPKSIIWEWGDVPLHVGEGRGKFIAEQASSSPSDCYDARLTVQKADKADARSYILTIENERGSDSTVVSLAISEPVSMSTVIGLVIGCLIFLVIVVLIVLYAFRAEKWCFRKDDDYKTKGDGIDGLRGRLKSSLGGRTGAIPPDALYTLPPKRVSNPEETNGHQVHQNDLNENKNSARDVDYTEVEVPKIETHSSNSHLDFRPQAHEVADI